MAPTSNGRSKGRGKTTSSKSVKTKKASKSKTSATTNKRKKRISRKPSKSKKQRSRGLGSGLSTIKLRCSSLLRPVFGLEVGATVTRGEAVKKLWQYIKANRLQDPFDGRSVICDETLRRLFGVSKISMLDIPGALAKHLSIHQEPHADGESTLTRVSSPVREVGDEEVMGVSPAFQRMIQQTLKLRKRSSDVASTDYAKLTRRHALRWLGKYLIAAGLRRKGISLIECDDLLRELFKVRTFSIHEAKGLVNRHLQPLHHSGESPDCGRTSQVPVAKLSNAQDLTVEQHEPKSLKDFAHSLLDPPVAEEFLGWAHRSQATQKCKASTKSYERVLSAWLENKTSQTSPSDFSPKASEAGRSQAAASEDDTLCIICMEKPRNASLVHGKSGHQVCCLKCAKDLKKRRHPCPVCRKGIDLIIENYL